MFTYLDWNVFDALKKLEDKDGQKDSYTSILSLIEQNKIVAPFSNAHMNDLYRGYVKNPDYIEGDLSIIHALTNDLCIVQYWGENNVRWHYRSPFEFFQTTKDECSITRKPYLELLSSNGEHPVIDSLWEAQKILLQVQPLPKEFKLIYTQDPIFGLIFPKSKENMNMLSLCEDLYDFSFKIQEDYALYKNYRKYLGQAKAKFPKYKKLIENSQPKSLIEQPKQLTWDSMFDAVQPKYKESSNPNHDKIVNLFTTTDLKGYSKDERFANMLDDALHTFYASHCDYFITNDKRCSDKAKLVYKNLGIKTVVVTPDEFINGDFVIDENTAGDTVR